MLKIKSVLTTAIILSIALITGCSEKIDASNDSNMKTTVSKILDSKNETEVQKFQEGYDSIINYSYAKVTNGELLDKRKDFSFILGEILNESNKNKKKFESVASSILSNMSYEEVVQSKKEYIEKTLQVINEANEKREEEAEKKAIIAAEEKEKKDKENELIEKHIAEQKKMDKELELKTKINNLTNSISENEAKIFGYSSGLEPYEIAEKAYDKVKIDNIYYSKPDGKRLQMDFNLINNSNYTIKSYLVNIKLMHDQESVIRKFGDISEENTIVPFGKKSINDRLYLTPIGKASTAEDISAEIEITVLFLINGKEYKVNEKGTEVSEIIKNNLNEAVINNENLNKELLEAKEELDTLK